MLSEFKKQEKAIKAHLEKLDNIPKRELFYELCFCLLTPQSKATGAEKCINFLKTNNFKEQHLDPTNILRQHIRFHNTKAKRLQLAKEQWPQIEEQINSLQGKELREWLVNNINGFGYKEASHFLRNIGERDLAILDRHTLKHLHKHQAIKEIPKTISKKKYLELEQAFLDFSKQVNIPIDELDLFFWSQETGFMLK